MKEDKVKDRILSAARDLFVKNGYDGTSVRDIADASGANVAHIKYYFQSKGHLFEIIFEESLDTLIKQIFPIIESDMPIFDLVEAWITAYYDLLPKYPQIPIFVINEMNHNPDKLAALVKKYSPERVILTLDKRFKMEYKKGTIKKIPAVDFALNVLSLSIFPFIFGRLVVKVSGVDPEFYRAILKRHKKYVVRSILDSLKP
ncbi:MAG: TetR family transcriptional regulator [Bacteroidales bacterium]|nr:TetR family transcriptional regulator [Bacteroidales bacterium]